MHQKKLIIISLTALGILSTVCYFTHQQINQIKTDIKPQQATTQKYPLGSCQKCGKALRTVNGKFGEFVSCSGYPDCKFILREKASFACLKCGTGAVEKRPWKNGILWGCSNYPECKFAIFSDIVDHACDKCNQSPYLLKKVDESGAEIIKCPQCKG